MFNRTVASRLIAPTPLVRRVVLQSRLSRPQQLRNYSAPATGKITTDTDTTEAELAAIDPGMNGGYVNPHAIKRQFRDPYAEWWDPQERKNFGEPVHEDEDVMGIFTPYEYTHIAPGKAFLQLTMFIGAVFGLCGIVYQFYPDKPAVPRTYYDNGLERSLGGKGALLAKSDTEE